MAPGRDSTCDPVSWLSATAKTMVIEPVSTTIHGRGNLTAGHRYTVAGQQPEVTTEQMAAQSQEAPARAQ